MKKIVTLLSLFVAQHAFAGSADVVVNCASKDKSVKISAMFPGDDLDEQVSITSKTVNKNYINPAEIEDAKANGDLPANYEAAAISGLDRTDIKVLTIVVNQGDVDVFDLAALPNTVKMRKTPYGQVGTFDAIVESQGATLSTTVSCTYTFER